MPDRHNWWRQNFCAKPECRKASKAESQRRWLSKPENKDVFRGWANAERVRQWRAKNPGYWKRRAKASGTLQEIALAQVPAREELDKTTTRVPLQDFAPTQDPLLLGLISHLVDSPLQDVVEQAALRLLEKGRDILGMRPGTKSKGNIYAGEETNPVRATSAHRSPTVQLGGPAPGAPRLRPTV